MAKSIMTTDGLIALLHAYPAGTPLAVTWEGVFRNIDASNVYTSKDGVVLIDADRNSYKDDHSKRDCLERVANDLEYDNDYYE